VIFDTTVLPPERLESYKTHVRRLRTAGVDPLTTPPHVRPASHSQMGGVLIDEHGWAGVPGLYAGGESAGGVHGASRLAGNGCADTLVFGALAGRGAANGMFAPGARDWQAIIARSTQTIRSYADRTGEARVYDIKEAVRHVMLRAAGLWRHHDTLAEGQDSLRDLARTASGDIATGDIDQAIEASELGHMLSTAQMIVQAALLRTESRGAHQRRDHKQQDDANWLKHTGFRSDRAGGFAHQDVPIQ
jgi:succinate dehydrogenase/fumarate reductase flavoprotein subunit